MSFKYSFPSATLSTGKNARAPDHASKLSQSTILRFSVYRALGLISRNFRQCFGEDGRSTLKCTCLHPEKKSQALGVPPPPSTHTYLSVGFNLSVLLNFRWAYVRWAFVRWTFLRTPGGTLRADRRLLSLVVQG